MSLCFTNLYCDQTYIKSKSLCKTRFYTFPNQPIPHIQIHVHEINNVDKIKLYLQFSNCSMFYICSMFDLFNVNLSDLLFCHLTPLSIVALPHWWKDRRKLNFFGIFFSLGNLFLTDNEFEMHFVDQQSFANFHSIQKNV